MVTEESVHKQLKALGFKTFGWGRAEVSELHNIMLPDEKIFDCVNGIYEGGFALLLATDVRVLLVDKKPLNYLTVEDLRFDMINEIDYNHRLIGANIIISTGSKTLRFNSFNQPRLRKLINHVQHAMAEGKKKESTHQEGQQQHLEQINQRLQEYLMAQNEQQQKMHEELESMRSGQATQPYALPIKPDNDLADYLYAQSLLAKHRAETGDPNAVLPTQEPYDRFRRAQQQQTADLYEEGTREIFGKRLRARELAITAAKIGGKVLQYGQQGLYSLRPTHQEPEPARR